MEAGLLGVSAVGNAGPRWEHIARTDPFDSLRWARGQEMAASVMREGRVEGRLAD